MSTATHDGDEAFASLRNLNERPPSYECIMALNEAFARNQKMLPLVRNGDLDNIRSNSIVLPQTQTQTDDINSKNLDVNGNFAHAITQCDINNCLDNNNNSNDQHPTTSASLSLPALNNNENAATTNNNNEEDEINGNDDSVVNWDISRANGIIKLDMSRIMDNTGLPTYEAALTLKSSNYI